MRIRRFGRRLGRRLTEPFPPVGGNELGASDHGPLFFHSMLDAIRTAEVSVDVEMYLWDDDEVGRAFVEALKDAAARGVRVRVLVDAVGARDVVEPLDAVDAAGGDVRVFNPFRIRFLRRYFHRTHKKLVVCDGRRAYTGGAGFSLHWSSGRHSEAPWHDRMFQVRGPLAAQLVALFETDFYRWRPRRAQTEVPPRRATELAAEGVTRARVLRGWPDARDFGATLLQHIRAAKFRVWLGSPYFIPPPSLIVALSRALRRGVDVRIVVPSGNFAHPLLWHASRRHYNWFTRRGGAVYEYTGVFYHAKLAVIDDTAAIVGSSNLDYWSWNRNAEIDIEVTDRPSVEFVAGLFEADRVASREVTRATIRHWAWWSRLQEGFVGWFERWL